MDPIAPDWRAIGAPPPPGPDHGGGGRPGSTLDARRVALAVGASLGAVLLGAIVALSLMPTTGGVVIDAGGSSRGGAVDLVTAGDVGTLADQGVTGTVEPRGVVVDVEGAVARPGLVRVHAGGRVGDALDLAGGFAPSADLAAAAEVLNLAQEATDGLKVMVPAIGAEQGRTTDTAPGGGPPTAGLVDLNRATESELDALPGVGPATIAKIVTAREEARFRSIDELRSRGIVGEATFEKLRGLISVGR